MSGRPVGECACSTTSDRYCCFKVCAQFHEKNRHRQCPLKPPFHVGILSVKSLNPMIFKKNALHGIAFFTVKMERCSLRNDRTKTKECSTTRYAREKAEEHTSKKVEIRRYSQRESPSKPLLILTGSLTPSEVLPAQRVVKNLPAPFGALLLHHTK